MEDNKRVLLGMSGGVDSSTSAILLKKQGYEVIGITIEMFHKDDDKSIEEAKKVCDELGIEHHSIDCQNIFKEKVIDDFCNLYSKCKTPNPCIECNKYLKFGVMYEIAKELNCNFISTGHYAKIEYSDKYGRYVIKKSDSLKKDQSYVLYNIPKEVVPHVVFPLAKFETKEEIRKIAEEHGLEVALKKDSEDICFIPDGDYKKFLEENSNIKPKKGKIVNKAGKVLGEHDGLYRYTIGQRRGLGIANPVPLFVIGYNPEKNELLVGEESELYRKNIIVSDVNLLAIDEIKNDIRANVKIRYSSKEAISTIKKIDNNTVEIIFDELQRGVTPGQSAVFYDEDIVIGGGKIK